jgi:hypothetical protein
VALPEKLAPQEFAVLAAQLPAIFWQEGAEGPPPHPNVATAITNTQAGLRMKASPVEF